MRLGVFSDTHGVIKDATWAMQNMGKIDALIHAGDIYTDALRLGEISNVPVHAVVGNCDVPPLGPEELTIVLEGHKIFITHGHFFRVKHGLQSLYHKAREIGARVVVFGHTHIPLNLWENNILFFNPGSPVNPQWGHPAGYGVLEITGQEIKGRLLSL